MIKCVTEILTQLLATYTLKAVVNGKERVHRTYTYNVKIICSLSCRPFIMTQSKNIPMTDPHFLHVQCNLNMHFGGGNKNHDYKETDLEILWDTMRSIYN